MLSASSAMPVSNYSTTVISEASGAVFRPGVNGRIRIRLPASLGMIDPHSSYLRFNLAVIPPPLATAATAVAANRRDIYQMGLSEGQGTDCLFESVRVLCDGRPLEEIAGYPILAKAKRDFCQDTAQQLVGSTFDKAVSQGSGAQDQTALGAFVTTYANGAGAAGNQVCSYAPATSSICSLDCSGVFSSKTGIPLIATGPIDLELTLADAADCLAPSGQTQAFYFTAVDAGANAGFVFLDIPPTSLAAADGTAAGFAQQGAVGAATDLGAAASLSFAVGNTIRLDSCIAADAQQFNGLRRLITNVTATPGGGIRLTFAGAIGAAAAGGAGQAFTGSLGLDIGVDEAGATRAIQYTYQITQPEMVCRVVELPPQYLESLQKRIMSQSLQLDIPSYTSYLNTVQANVQQQSLSVPAFQSRVRSILSVPQLAAQRAYAPSRVGDWDGLRQYQHAIGARREPSRPVSVINTTTNATAYASQEHIYELHKAFEASGHSVKTLLRHADNLVVGRSLSAMGGSEDLSEKGYRLELQYNTAAVAAKNCYTYVYSINRVEVSPSGVQILT